MKHLTIGFQCCWDKLSFLTSQGLLQTHPNPHSLPYLPPLDTGKLPMEPGPWRLEWLSPSALSFPKSFDSLIATQFKILFSSIFLKSKLKPPFKTPLSLRKKLYIFPSEFRKSYILLSIFITLKMYLIYDVHIFSSIYLKLI